MKYIVSLYILFLTHISVAQPQTKPHTFLYGGKNYLSTDLYERVGVLSEQGETLVPFAYSKIIETPIGLIVFKINKSDGLQRSYSLGFYNRNFKLVLPCQFGSLLPIENGYLIAQRNTEKKFGLVDTIGQIIIPFIYDELSSPTEDLFLAKKDSKFGFINRKNHVVIDFEFDYAAPFSEGLAAASKSQQIGFISKKGHFEIPQIFSSANDFHYGYAQVFFHNLATCIDHSGKILFPTIFNSLSPAGNNQFIFEANQTIQASFLSYLKELPIAQSIAETDAYSKLNLSEEWDMDFMEETYHFMGVIDAQGNLIGNQCFQQVILLKSQAEKQLYAVQRQSDLEDDSTSYLFAIMNEKGEFISGFDYFDVKPEDSMLLKDTKNGIEYYEIDSEGNTKRLNY